MKKNWMAELTYHYEKTRRRYPQDRLMILFDIDGTILDMRYMVFHVLKAFDKKHDTHFFRKLSVSDITVHENQVDSFLAELRIPSEEQREIIKWYNQHRWSSEYILQSHHPFSGVLEVIRWFQLQPNTFVGLNTGRPESILSDTLRSLNKLGKEYKVQFSDELLHMNPQGWEQEVENSKVAGVRHFQKKGYRIFAFVDNEPDNLKVVSNIDPDQEILLLHANTIFESKRTRLPSRTVKGKAYDITELIPEKELPQHIQFVWHGINDEVNLRQFLASEITWGECDVRMDPIANELILRHDSFVELPLDVDEEWFSLDRLLHRLLKTGKSIKLDLKAGGILVDKVLKFIESSSFDESCLWFNGNVERLQEQGFRKLASAYPNAILQCPVDFLAPLISSAPEKAKEILDMFIKWGINRFSISWKTQDMRNFFDQMDKWGFEVNIYNVPDLESFLEVVLLMPRSITSDFNFPKWHYYGRGSGEDGSHYEYSIRKTIGRR
ncbi:MAG: HAD family hydrolase [Candidatus Aminicenantes bacterium]|nr:MAG: HAD family hydrolase [Candidatus Aminicenantes bacterium]